MEILSTSWRLAAAALAAVWLALAPATGAAADAGSLEYAVKANYLYKFAAYVEWPASAFASPASPLKLCVVGEDPFGALLDQAVSGQRVNGRPVAIQRLKSLARDADCHILYLGQSSPQLAAQTVDALRGSRMLTVSDAPGVGAVVSFIVRDRRGRFSIDDDAAAQTGLVISSKLLDLALSVKPRPSR